MLGGDNMDLALGRHVEIKLFGQPGKLEAARWHQLVQQCRKAKETLLGATAGRPPVDITVVGTGGKLIASTLKSNLTQAEVDDVLVNGFLPTVDLTTPLQSGRRAGLSELGLPYVQDPAITRHLADFWRRFRGLLQEESGRAEPFPDFLLFNGGGARIQRLCVNDCWGWWPTGFRRRGARAGHRLNCLTPDPIWQSRSGAAYYGLVRQGEGVRVGSGSPRTYYVGVETTRAGATAYRAVCLVPRGTEEGAQVTLAAPEFAALTNQPVTFQIYASSTRLGDKVGEVVTLEAGEVTVLPPIRTILHYGRKSVAQQLPVRLAVRLTEIGTLELWCQSKQSDHSWQLAFDVRGEVDVTDIGGGIESVADQATLALAQRAIERTFGVGDDGTGNYTPEGLRKRLETILELPKEAWPTHLIRKLADTFLAVAEGRKRSFQHEAFWLNLLGFCLRPGYGDPGDELRMKTVWGINLEGMVFNRPQVRTEWWICWRRVAAGLKAGHQLQIFEQVRASLEASAGKKRTKGGILSECCRRIRGLAGAGKL